MAADREDNGYLLAKLEGIDQRLAAMCDYQRKQAEELDTIGNQLREYTAQWKAVRLMGAILVAVIISVKTGDLSAIKALFGSP